MRFWIVDKENGKVTLETPEGITVTFINLDEVETVAQMLLDEVEEMEDEDDDV